MSDEIQLPEITDGMKHILDEVWKHALPPKEKTFFSIEGIIGRYEVPTSKLLWFFMSPNEGHELGLLFLRAFFSCLPKEDNCDVRFKNVSVEREVRTADGKFIDLLVSGLDWVLLIENKICAEIYNPFDSYEEHAKRYYGKNIFRAILSPDGKKSDDWPKWKPVSYQEYCDALKREFAKAVFDHPISKWQVFAREFINHLENELCKPIMKMRPDQKAFVEENLRQIEEIKMLSKCYIAEFQQELKQSLLKAVPSEHSFDFYLPESEWAHLCIEKIGNLTLQLMFQTPAQKGGNLDERFRISAGVFGLMPEQLDKVKSSLPMECRHEEGEHYWESSFDSRAEAVNGLCKLAKDLLPLLENEPGNK